MKTLNFIISIFIISLLFTSCKKEVVSSDLECKVTYTLTTNRAVPGYWTTDTTFHYIPDVPVTITQQTLSDSTYYYAGRNWKQEHGNVYVQINGEYREFTTKTDYNLADFKYKIDNYSSYTLDDSGYVYFRATFEPLPLEKKHMSTYIINYKRYYNFDGVDRFDWVNTKDRKLISIKIYKVVYFHFGKKQEVYPDQTLKVSSLNDYN